MSLYRVRVYPFESVAGRWDDERPAILFSGSIEMTDLEAYELRERLNALRKAEMVGDFTVSQIHSTYTDQTLLLGAILAPLNGEARDDVREIWERNTVR